ncbi:hypothetical protein PUN28_019447 [Cardiocondyla obscurior]|uniref:Secreted protein n=1 Tax=Cardiocondyla obscurior TaxID=286306 RepID=A0AAW2EC98_9HYME
MRTPPTKFSPVLSLLSALHGSRTRSAVWPDAHHASSRTLAAVAAERQAIIAGQCTSCRVYILHQQKEKKTHLNLKNALLMMKIKRSVFITKDKLLNFGKAEKRHVEL